MGPEVDLRETLSNAMNELTESAPAHQESEQATTAPPSVEPITAEVPEQAAPPQSVPVADLDKPAPIEEVVKKSTVDPLVPAVDRPPQSWKNEAKGVWSALPLEARQEVMRRERETSRVLQEAAAYRQQIGSIQEVIKPHLDRINQVYQGNPITALSNLLGIERTLFSGTPQDKINLVASLIREFKVDLPALDATLVGQPIPQETQQLSHLEQLINQRLQPVMSFVEQQRASQEAQSAKATQELETTVAQMAVDPAYPYFEEVREDMADLIDMAGKKGLYLSLPDAYNKAVRLNDSTFQAANASTKAQQTTQVALAQHQAAQKAKGAAVSVSGTPSTVRNVGDASNLRGTIESLFNGSLERI